MSHTIYARLLDAYAHLHCARVQRLPTDDKIIADHIEVAEHLVAEALQEMRNAGSVITWPRPSYHKQAVGMRAEDMLPLATLAALNGDDTPDDAA